MSKIPMLERFAAQSLVEHEGELIFSKEKFAELIVRECVGIADEETSLPYNSYGEKIRKHFGVES